MKIQIFSIIISSILLASCVEDHRETSFSLQSALEGTEVNCDYLAGSKFSKGYWVRSELDGWGVLIISSSNEENTYELSLLAHGHERAFETRKIECGKL
jgi:hypothetical protein